METAGREAHRGLLTFQFSRSLISTMLVIRQAASQPVRQQHEEHGMEHFTRSTTVL